MNSPASFSTVHFPYPFNDLLDEGSLSNDADTMLTTLLQQCESLAAVVESTLTNPAFRGFEVSVLLNTCAPTVTLLHAYLTCTRKLYTAWTHRGEAAEEGRRP